MSGLIMLILLIPASPVGSLGTGNILVPGDSRVPWEHLCPWKQTGAWGRRGAWLAACGAARALQCIYQTSCTFTRDTQSEYTDVSARRSAWRWLKEPK